MASYCFWTLREREESGKTLRGLMGDRCHLLSSRPQKEEDFGGCRDNYAFICSHAAFEASVRQLGRHVGCS